MENPGPLRSAINSAECQLEVTTAESSGHVCEYLNATDFKGNDQPALVAADAPADGSSAEGYVDNFG
eukprot:9493190-Pyramimonas_sp.AAC.2